MPDNFSDNELTALPFVLSQPRFATYLRAAQGNSRMALALYRWNAEISSAFFLPLQLCEVAIRNAAAEAIEAVHGADWPWRRGFCLSLPVRRWGYRPAEDLQSTARTHHSTGQVIAELKFAFWQSIFTSGQDERIWNAHLRAVLPHLPLAPSIAALRGQVHDSISNVRSFRNRIAHHEPIFSRNVGEDYKRILSMIAWRSIDAAAWVDRTQIVTTLLAVKPRPVMDGLPFQYPVR